MIDKNFLIGLLLIGLGVIFLLLILNMLTITWLLFLLSIGLILTYVYKGDMAYIIGGLILFAISSVSLIDQYLFPGINIKIFIYLSVLGCSLIYFFYKTKERSFLIFSNIILSVGINHLINQIAPISVPWFKFILMSLGFFIIYLLLYRINGIVWPKYVAYTLSGIGLIYLLYVNRFFQLNFVGLGYFISLVIILIGSKIVYLSIKENR